jgi:hypothetical protein
MTSDRGTVHPQEALAVYVEPLAVGQRVMILGDASLGLGTHIAELGARLVCVWDPNADRARRAAENAPPGVTVRPLLTVDQIGQEGAFDLAVVTDLELFDEPEVLLANVRRSVGQDGAALIVAPNGAASGRSTAFDYYELFDLVAREFEEVTMIAQLPFYGVALAELGEDEDESPSVSVDTQLAGGDRAPDAFIALASQQRVRLDPYAIVELPPSQSATERVAEEVTQRFEEVVRDQVGRIAQLEEELSAQVRHIAHLSSELDRASVELTRAGDAHTSEVARYEEALRERAQAVRLLETELDRRDRMVRELVDQLESTMSTEHLAPGPKGSPSPEGDTLAEENSELRRKLDALALELARHEGERQARAWTIAELERRLAAAADLTQVRDSSAGPNIERQLAAALDELDVLKRALTQEHEARVRAESGQAAPLPRDRVGLG